MDPSGRGQGDCELLDLPLSQLDFQSDIHSHPDYDYYERDRNATPDCKQRLPGRYIPSGGSSYIPRPSGNRYTPRPSGYSNDHYYSDRHQNDYSEWNRSPNRYYGGQRPYTDHRGGKQFYSTFHACVHTSFLSVPSKYFRTIYNRI